MYPIPAYYYKVSFGGADIGFSEVGGLTIENEPIEYRDGLMSPTTLSLRRPGKNKGTNITLKRGMLEGNNDLYAWFANTGSPNVERRDLTITLLNDEAEPVFVWNVTQAWPIKFEGPGLNASENNIAIETIELVHEGITQSVA